MIAVDTNILVYGHRRDIAHHDSAKELLRSLAEGDEQWAIPWPCIHEFCAIATNPRIFKGGDATSPKDALRQVDAWLKSPSVVCIHESDTYWSIFRRICAGSLPKGGLFHDARIYAICESHEVALLYSADRDFAMFSGNVAIKNPLI